MRKLCFILCIITLLFAFNSCVSYDENIDNYYRDIEEYNADKFMPDLLEIGAYQSIEYYCRKDEPIFPIYSMKLIVKYDAETFAKEKERLEGAYTYLQEPQKAEFDEKYYTIPVVRFSVGEFDFRVVELEDTCYPKNFGMIGISEKSCTVVYLWSYDVDCDYICAVEDDGLKEMYEYVSYRFHLE